MKKSKQLAGLSMLILLLSPAVYALYTPASAATPAGQPVAAAVVDVSAVPPSDAVLPPFPYLDWPAKLENGYRNPKESDYAQVHMIVGRGVRTLEGRVAVRSFPNRAAGLSPAAALGDYRAAIRALGGVKVNGAMPNDATWLRQQAGTPDALHTQLDVWSGGRGMTAYDVYLIRHTQGNIWISLSAVANGGDTRLTVVQEKPLEQTIALIAADGTASAPKPGVLVPPAPTASVEPDAVPTSSVALPPFPFLDWPSRLAENGRDARESENGHAYMIADRGLRALAGRVSERSFANDKAHLSSVAAQRSYAAAIVALGGAKVNAVLPTDAAWLRQQGRDVQATLNKLDVWSDGRGLLSYDVFLIPHDQGNIWIALSQVDDGLNTRLKVVQEKPDQAVRLADGNQ